MTTRKDPTQENAEYVVLQKTTGEKFHSANNPQADYSKMPFKVLGFANSASEADAIALLAD